MPLPTEARESRKEGVSHTGACHAPHVAGFCRYEPKDVEVRLATSSNHSLRGPIITRNLPKAAGWVSLFDRQRDMSEHQESLQVSRGNQLSHFKVVAERLFHAGSLNLCACMCAWIEQDLLQELDITVTFLLNWDGGANTKVNCIRCVLTTDDLQAGLQLTLCRYAPRANTDPIHFSFLRATGRMASSPWTWGACRCRTASVCPCRSW